MSFAATPHNVVDCLLLVDDGSTDNTAAAARSGGAEVLSMGKTCGVGAALAPDSTLLVASDSRSP